MKLVAWIILLPFFVFSIIIICIFKFVERFYIGLSELMNRIREIANGNKTKNEDRKAAREEKRGSRRDYRIEKIKALTAKAYAVASKRKWLVYMIGLGIAVYFILTSGAGGAGGGLGGMVETIKGFFN